MRTHIKFISCLILFSCFVTTSVFWTFEKDINHNIHSFYDVLWWWAVTSSTVGYGDVYPVTSPGRIASVVAIITGIYTYTNFVTLTAGKIEDTLESHEKGTARVKCKNHLVICEYTAFADELIQEIDRYPEFVNRDIVIISDLVGKNPYLQHSFVSGVPINPESLRKANVEKADHIFVFANARFKDPDLKTLHIVSRIQKLNKHATIFIELFNPENEIVKHISGFTNRIVPLDSKKMLESVLLRGTLDLESYMTLDAGRQDKTLVS